MKQLKLVFFVLIHTIITSRGFTQVMKEVRIGSQIWMQENLNTNKFRNGEPIPEAKSPEEWKLAEKNKQPAWCYYDNNEANGLKYGKLYNWYAVVDPRGIAPEGWHIPTDFEWTKLTEYLGGELEAGKKLKSRYGFKLKDNGTNEFGFTGLPGGYVDEGLFKFLGVSCSWWSSSSCESGCTGGGGDEAWYRLIFCIECYNIGVQSIDGKRDKKLYSDFIKSSNEGKELGLSVRCLKDIDRYKNEAWISYYKNGQVKVKGHEINGKEDGEWISYYENGQVKEIGNYIDGKKNGEWISYNENGQVQRKHNYVNGHKKIVTISEKENPTIEEQKIISSESDNKVYGGNEVDKVAEFPGGQPELMRYISKNLKYPVKEREASIQGSVFVKFVIQQDGTISNPEIIKGVIGGEGLSNEAIRVVKELPNWKPAEKNNKAVNSYYTIPIKFRVQ